MPRRGLTSEWSIELDGSFRSRTVDGSLQMVSPGPPTRTIWIDVWGPPAHRAPEDVLEEILEDINPAPDLRFREAGTGPEELRYASWYTETDGERQQWELYAYTVRAGSYVQAVLLTDSPADLDWAPVHLAIATLHPIELRYPRSRRHMGMLIFVGRPNGG
jgi:hypothetical protein